MQIEDLLEQDYSLHPRIQERIIGESAAIRLIDSNDLIDMMALKRGNDDPRSQKFIQSDIKSDTELLAFVKKKDVRLFGVAGVHGVTEPKEVGELQGWILAQSLSLDKVDELHQKQLDYLIPPYACAIELVAAKIPDKQRGQMESGLRQVATLLLKAYSAIRDDIFPPQHFHIVGYIRDDNNASQNMAKAVGFIREERYSSPPYSLYVLDWIKLHEISERLIKGELFHSEEFLRNNTTKSSNASRVSLLK